MTLAEDDISIDLSKISGLFKPKSKPKREKSAEKQEDDLSLDLGSIKSVFKHNDKSSDDFALGDLSSAFKLLGRYIIPIILISTFLLSVYLRMQPAYLPITDKWAQDSVYAYYKNTILSGVNQKYPNLPTANKNELVNEEFSKLLAEKRTEISQQISSTSQQFKKELQDEHGQTYLLAIDPYYWLRFVENKVNLGHYGDEVVDGRQFDNHFMAPNGRVIGEDDFHIRFEYWMYKVMNFFNKDVYPMKAAFYVPILLAALCVIPAFFIARKIGGNTGGFFAALMVAMHSAFLSRTAGGFADTDAYNVLFPLLITWLFLEAFDEKDPKKTLLYSLISGFFVGIYSFTWGGWWYIFDFLVGVAGLYIAYYVFTNRDGLLKGKSRKQLAEFIFDVGAFVIASALFVCLFTGWHNFARTATGPIGFIRLKEVGRGTIWPNVYTTVAEQNELSLDQVVASIGGKLLLLISIIGVAMTLLKKDKHGKIEIRYAILLSIWMLSTIYASTKGVRFLLLLVPAYSIALGVFMGVASKYVSQFFSKELRINQSMAKAVVILLMLLLFIGPFKQAKVTAEGQIPSVNDAWVRSLNVIKTNSSDNAIVNSWWDFGHWFKYWADRPVTFDGTSQNTPQAHWIGKVLLTENEDMAIAILRMVDCGGNDAFVMIENATNDSLKAVKLTREIIMLDRTAAKQRLIEVMPDNDVEKVLEKSHCEPPEDFFITSEDMVGKSGVWAHFGSWNFTKSDMVARVKSKNRNEGIKILQDRFGLSSEEADRYYYEIKTQDADSWIAPWPSFASGLSTCKTEGEIISCTNSIKFNITSEEAYVDTPQGKLRPKSFSYVDKQGTFRNIQYTEQLIKGNNGVTLGAALFPVGGSYQSVLMAPELTGSLFTRLFYFGGTGLKHFALVHSDRDLTGLDIYVWKVNWGN
ncbi:MAG: STT3 domain-containing protein [Candidatus Woesearchaeota archaeon]